MESSPFYVENEAAYQRWRAAKLERYPATAEELVVPVDNPLSLTDAEAVAMLNICRKTNMIIYASRVMQEDKEIPRAVGECFGLRRLDSNVLADDDGITSLQVVPGSSTSRSRRSRRRSEAAIAMSIATRLVLAWYEPRLTPLAAALAPLSLLFRVGVAARRSLYGTGVLASVRVPVQPWSWSAI